MSPDPICLLLLQFHRKGSSGPSLPVGWVFLPLNGGVTERLIHRTGVEMLL
jgi:hypothetical protein